MNMNTNVLDNQKRCSSCGEYTSTPLRCGACQLINYCSQACQKKDWTRHKHCCKQIRPLMTGENIIQPGSAKALQLQRRGTSYGNPARMSEEAEDIAPEARRLKQTGRYDQAVAAYTRCLELDCYNHLYSFHRAETFFMAASAPGILHDRAIEDARYTIALDPKFQPAWSLLIRCLIDSMDWEQAGSVCDDALRLFPRGAERHDMFKQFRLDINKIKQRRRYFTRIYEVADYNDDLYFFYTAGTAKDYHPEVLSVDLPYPDPCSHRIVKHLKKKKEENESFQFSLGTSIWIKKTKQWVSPIPVTDQKQRKQIFKHLMTRTDPKSKVVVLKVDSSSKETPPQPLTKEQAESYIGEIVKNAPQVQALYNRGEKLVADSFIASFGSLSLGEDD